MRAEARVPIVSPPTPSHACPEAPRPPLTWVVILVGALVATPASESRARAGLGRSDRSERDGAGEGREPGGAPGRWLERFLRAPDERELARMCPRELRRLPGLGQVRAIDVARATSAEEREAAPEVRERLEEVRGIGEVTARRVARWLEEER